MTLPKQLIVASRNVAAESYGRLENHRYGSIRKT